ncbi:DUF6126 family protein [Streptomyces sp. NBC_01264]|uniref:DUF6126 family protein n=1 Tax=Streptomyces sp. NBC_01264 TaxID=2903804 RepID=UPI00224FEE29|nr:DUF6126 family protein [Streptomyces sp. NBC_01264]MCX4782276.1 DUF6126 family protein [Streptomyces sp. NBC_01264]
MPETQQTQQAQQTPQHQPTPQPQQTPQTQQSKFPRGLIIRLIAYLFVGHLFAFFVYLLFVLGAQNQ